MRIRDKLALRFRRFLDWTVGHEPPVCEDCDEFIRHCWCIAKDGEDA